MLFSSHKIFSHFHWVIGEVRTVFTYFIPPCFASSSCQLKGSLNVESGELPLVVSDFSVSPCEVYYFFPHTHSRANVFSFGVDVLHCEPSRLFQLLDLLLFLLFTKKIKKDQILLFDVGDDS